MSELLILYTRNRCDYCSIVQDVVSEMKIDLEERNISENDKWRDELILARGTDTVPILRRETTDSESHWLPESDAIVRYLLSNHDQN